MRGASPSRRFAERVVAGLYDGGVPEPEACNPDLPENTCCNLEGRGDRPECQ